MFYQFCFVLVLVAASNGQRYLPYAASPPANNRPNTNVSPNDNRIQPTPAPGANLNFFLNSSDSSNRVPNNNNGSFISAPRQPNINIGRLPGSNNYESTPYNVANEGDRNGNGYESTNGNDYESTAYPPTRNPNLENGRNPNGNGYESTAYPPITDANLGNGLKPTTDNNIHFTDPNGFDITTKSNDLYSTTDNYVTMSDPNHIYPGLNNTGVTGKNDAVCRRRFGYYRVEGSCDAYVECRNFEVNRRLCPDGMHFNPNAHFPEYPCGYPGDVPCIGRGNTQRSKPTHDCPHQFGFFPITDKSLSPTDRCSRYVMCSAGKANIMDCPFGLAFSAASGRCDWPEQVPGCQEFLGFHCPTPDLGEEDLVMNYKYSDKNCYYFWSCENGRARVLSCDYGLAFDPDTGRCVDEELVRCVDDDREEPLEPHHDESTPSSVYLM